MPDSSEFTDEDLREALKDLGSYVDVTEEDLKKIYSLALKHARQRLAASVAVADAMTPEVVAVGKNDDIATAVRFLSENRISGLPVVDNDKRLIGLVSLADLIAAKATSGRAGVQTLSHRFRADRFPRQTRGARRMAVAA